MRTTSREHAGNRDHAVVLGTSIAGPPRPVAPTRFQLSAAAVPAPGWCYPDLHLDEYHTGRRLDGPEGSRPYTQDA
jgi:hypothetical protein